MATPNLNKQGVWTVTNDGSLNENLLLNSDTVFNSNGSRLSSKTVFNGLINNSSAPNGKYRSWKIVAENEVNRGVYYQYSVLIGTLDNLTQNEIYTLSFWARCSKNKNLMVSSLVESQSIQKFDDGKTVYNSNSTIVVDNIWEKHSVVFKWTSITKMTICFYLRSLDEDVVLDIAAPKLEKGDKATLWTPNPSDTDYISVSPTSGIIETGNITRVYSNRMDAHEFYEI